MFYIVGLGNPGKEYQQTRHNTGRFLVEKIAKKFKKDFNLKDENLISEIKILNQKVKLILPNNYMNNSGKSLASLIKTKKDIEKLIVIHDDLDLPFKKIKISFNKSSAGHKGVESIIKKLKTQSFIRIRIGISPKDKKKIKDLNKFLLGNFSKQEIKELEKVSLKVFQIISTIIKEGKEKAMSIFNI